MVLSAVSRDVQEDIVTSVQCGWLRCCSSSFSEHQGRWPKCCFHPDYVRSKRQSKTRWVLAVKRLSGFLATPYGCPKGLGRTKMKFAAPEQVKDVT